MIEFDMTNYSSWRARSRRVPHDRLIDAVNNPSTTMPSQADRRKHIGYRGKDGKEVVAVTTWPPSADGKVVLVTCYFRDA